MKTRIELIHNFIDLDSDKGTVTVEFRELTVTQPWFIFFWVKPEIRSERTYREEFIRGAPWPGHWRQNEGYKYTYYRVKDLKHIDDIGYHCCPHSQGPNTARRAGKHFDFHALRNAFTQARNEIAQKEVTKTLKSVLRQDENPN